MHESISINIKTLRYYHEEMLQAGHKLDQAKWGLYLHTAELSRRPQDPRMYESHDPRIPGYLNPRILESQDTGSQDAWIYLQPAQPPPSHSLVLESSFNMNARAKPGALNVFQLKGKVGELNPNISRLSVQFLFKHFKPQMLAFMLISCRWCWLFCWFCWWCWYADSASGRGQRKGSWNAVPGWLASAFQIGP